MIRTTTGLLATLNDKGQIDSGDTLSNEMFIRIAQLLKRAMLLEPLYIFEILPQNQMLAYLYGGNGFWMRSPERDLNMGKFLPSRDQWVMAFTWCLLTDNLAMAHDTLKWLKANKWRYPNGDVALGELWLTAKRFNRFGFYWEWVPLWVWDLFILFGSFNRCGWLPRYKHDFDFGNGVRGPKWLWGTLAKDDVGDDKVHCMQVCLALLFKPTWVSRLAAKIYFRYRPQPYFATDDQYMYTVNNPSKALYYYFRSASGNNPEIAHEWDAILNSIERAVNL